MHNPSDQSNGEVELEDCDTRHWNRSTIIDRMKFESRTQFLKIRVTSGLVKIEPLHKLVS